MVAAFDTVVVQERVLCTDCNASASCVQCRKQKRVADGLLLDCTPETRRIVCDKACMAAYLSATEAKRTLCGTCDKKVVPPAQGKPLHYDGRVFCREECMDVHIAKCPECGLAAVFPSLWHTGAWFSCINGHQWRICTLHNLKDRRIKKPGEKTATWATGPDYGPSCNCIATNNVAPTDQDLYHFLLHRLQKETGNHWYRVILDLMLDHLNMSRHTVADVMREWMLRGEDVA